MWGGRQEWPFELFQKLTIFISEAFALKLKCLCRETTMEFKQIWNAVDNRIAILAIGCAQLTIRLPQRFTCLGANQQILVSGEERLCSINFLIPWQVGARLDGKHVRRMPMTCAPRDDHVIRSDTKRNSSNHRYLQCLRKASAGRIERWLDQRGFCQSVQCIIQPGRGGRINVNFGKSDIAPYVFEEVSGITQVVSWT